MTLLVVSLEVYAIFGGVGLLSVMIVLIGGERWLGVAGYSYFLTGPALTFHSYRRRKAREALQVSTVS